MTPKRIVLHHSLTKDSGTVSWGAIRKYHIETMHWTAIGYAAGLELVNDRYEILIGRMLNEQGAHTAGHNQDSLGICCVGNFDEIDVPKQQWDLAVRFATSLCDLFSIPTDEIYGHREFNPLKTCPGTHFDLNEFRILVEEKRQMLHKPANAHEGYLNAL